MNEVPVATRHALTLLAGPERIGSEQRWRVRLDDGRLAVLGRLLPELAADPAIRRRYVHDLERLGALADAGLAPLIEVGPAPDPRDPEAPPPWRLRLDPPGETFAAWIARRAPAPIDEVSAIGAAIADRLAAIHDRGVIVRDLAPRCIVLGDDHRVTFTDVGLARVDILSTRTAASLLIEDSPYVAPEELSRTLVDPRADLHRLGVMLFQALTGALPFGAGAALLSSERAPPGLRKLRADVPPALESVILRCLAAEPGQRPATARVVASILRGQAHGDAGPRERVVCQACGAALRLGQRLCLSCGKEAVRFAHASAGAPTFALELTKASEDTDFSRRLQRTLGALASAEVPALNLVIGDRRMYSKAELARRHPLPLRLFDNLSKTTAEALRLRLAEQKIVTRVRKSTDTAQRRRHVVVCHLVEVPAVAHPEHGAAVREVVHRGDGLGEGDRVALDRDRDGGAEADCRRHRGGGREGDPRVQGAAVPLIGQLRTPGARVCGLATHRDVGVLGHVERGEARLLGGHGGGGRPDPTVAGEQGESEFHVSPRARPPRLPTCLLYTSPSPRDRTRSRMPSSA